jgi:hypothetical protein
MNKKKSLAKQVAFIVVVLNIFHASASLEQPTEDAKELNVSRVLELPTELILMTLTNLDKNNLLPARKVCRTFASLIDDPSFLFPKNEDELISLLAEPAGKISANLKLLLLINLPQEKRLEYAQKFLEIAEKHFADHSYFMNSQIRDHSNMQWHSYLKLLQLARNLDSAAAEESWKDQEEFKLGQLLTYVGDLSQCTPEPNLDAKICIFVWEQAARINQDERLKLIRAYREGEEIEGKKIGKDLQRAAYWEAFNFTQWLGFPLESINFSS